MTTRRKPANPPKGRQQRAANDPYAPPPQFLVPANNRDLIERASSMAKKTAAARQAMREAQDPAPRRGARKVAREPIPVRELAEAWAPATYTLRDSSSGESDDASRSDEPSEAEFDDDDEVIDLEFIARRRPPPGVVRNFLRAQATSINDARSEDEFS